VTARRRTGTPDTRTGESRAGEPRAGTSKATTAVPRPRPAAEWSPAAGSVADDVLDAIVRDRLQHMPGLASREDREAAAALERATVLERSVLWLGSTAATLADEDTVTYLAGVVQHGGNQPGGGPGCASVLGWALETLVQQGVLGAAALDALRDAPLPLPQSLATAVIGVAHDLIAHALVDHPDAAEDCPGDACAGHLPGRVLRAAMDAPAGDCLSALGTIAWAAAETDGMDRLPGGLTGWVTADVTESLDVALYSVLRASEVSHPLTAMLLAGLVAEFETDSEAVATLRAALTGMVGRTDVAAAALAVLEREEAEHDLAPQPGLDLDDVYTDAHLLIGGDLSLDGLADRAGWQHAICAAAFAVTATTAPTIAGLLRTGPLFTAVPGLAHSRLNGEPSSSSSSGSSYPGSVQMDGVQLGDAAPGPVPQVPDLNVEATTGSTVPDFAAMFPAARFPDAPADAAVSGCDTAGLTASHASPPGLTTLEAPAAGTGSPWALGPRSAWLLSAAASMAAMMWMEAEASGVEAVQDVFRGVLTPQVAAEIVADGRRAAELFDGLRHIGEGVESGSVPTVSTELGEVALGMTVFTGLAMLLSMAEECQRTGATGWPNFDVLPADCGRTDPGHASAELLKGSLAVTLLRVRDGLVGPGTT